MNMKLQRKRELVFVVSFILLSSILIGLSYFFRTINMNNRTSAYESEDNDINYAPVILTIPPQSVRVGELYTYTIVVDDVDNENEDIKYTLKSGPSWIQLEGNKLYGTPHLTDAGDAKIEVSITDGINVVNKTFYVVVK